jgi:hypothetical protein
MTKKVMWEITPAREDACPMGVILKHDWACIKQATHLPKPQSSKESCTLYRAKKFKAIVK